MARAKLVERALLGAAVALFAVLLRYHWHHVCDNGFIAFRYAEHVAAGAGPVWSLGERVEGFSSPSWLALLALGRALGAALPAWAGAWGIAFAGLALLMAHRLALALSGSRLVAAAATLGGALLYPLHYWAPAGLETAWFAALVTAAAWSLLARSPWAWAPVAGLLGVTRPEGPGLAVALLVLSAVVRGRAVLRPGLLALALGPALAWQVFRLAYFGAWLPNTYAAKATGEWLSRLTSGTLYAMPGLVALAVTVGAVVVGGTGGRAPRCVLGFLAACLAIVMVAGGDWMWHGRMIAPVLPALLAVAVAAVAAAPARRRLALGAVCVLGWAAWLPRPPLLFDAVTMGRLPATAYQEGTLVSASLEAAHYIAELFPAEALVAVNHAGALPYALPNPALDMAGLCDRHIAREVAGGLHRKFDADYVLARRPRVVVLNSRTRPGSEGIWYHPGYWAGETALVQHRDFAVHYYPLPVFWQWHWRAAGGGGYVMLYERVD